MNRRAAPMVYFIRRADEEDGPVKIGCSQSPEIRLQTLNFWTPYPLKLAAQIPGDEGLEQRFHARFIAQHSHSEWFRPSADLDAVIAQVADGTFDVSTLPPGKRLAPTNRSEMSAETRRDMGDAHRLHWMKKWGYPIPQAVHDATWGRYLATPAELAKKRRTVRDFISAHYAEAQLLRDQARLLKKAA